MGVLAHRENAACCLEFIPLAPLGERVGDVQPPFVCGCGVPFHKCRNSRVPRRGTISLAVGETHGQRPSNPNPYRPRRGRTFSLSVGGKPHSTPAGLAAHRGASFPWVSPTANDIGPLRGPPPGSGGKAHPSTSMSRTHFRSPIFAGGAYIAVYVATGAVAFRLRARVVQGRRSIARLEAVRTTRHREQADG
jgi:hypothetical protein